MIFIAKPPKNTTNSAGKHFEEPGLLLGSVGSWVAGLRGSGFVPHGSSPEIHWCRWKSRRTSPPEDRVTRILPDSSGCTHGSRVSGGFDGFSLPRVISGSRAHRRSRRRRHPPEDRAPITPQLPDLISLSTSLGSHISRSHLSVSPLSQSPLNLSASHLYLDLSVGRSAEERRRRNEEEREKKRGSRGLLSTVKKKKKKKRKKRKGKENG
jgi:hypothetical protein